MEDEMVIDLENREDFAAYLEALAMQAEEISDEVVAEFLHAVAESLLKGTFEELSELVRKQHKSIDIEDPITEEGLQNLLKLMREGG